MTHPDTIALATYDAMRAPPPFVQLANSLLAADSTAQRDALLKTATPKVRDASMRYLSEPEATRERTRRLEWMRADPRRVVALRVYYKGHIADFISEYGTTYDPRLIVEGRNPLVPFVLFPKQRDLVQFIIDRMNGKQHGTVCKGRDVGATATCVAALLTLCMLARPMHEPPLSVWRGSDTGHFSDAMVREGSRMTALRTEKASKVDGGSA